MEVNSPSSGNPTWNTRSDAAPAGLYALGVVPKDNVFAGRTCLYSLDSRRGGPQAPFKTHGVCLLRSVERDSMWVTPLVANGDSSWLLGVRRRYELRTPCRAAVRSASSSRQLICQQVALKG
jgi:hypothetical protein